MLCSPDYVVIDLSIYELRYATFVYHLEVLFSERSEAERGLLIMT